MDDYGIKVALPGYDATKATPEQCSLHSSYPALKSKTDQENPHHATLKVDFTSGISQGSTHTIYSFEHGYDYVPLNFASIVLDVGSTIIYGINRAAVGSTLDVSVGCTATHFEVKVFDNFNWIDSNTTLEISYYIFAEDGE